jgi:two-component system OmpR family sensor kinase
MNNLSFKIKLLGFFIGLLVTTMTYFAMEYAINYSKGREITNSILLYKTLRKNESKDIANYTHYLEDNHLKQLPKQQALKIIAQASFVIKTPIYREVFESGNISLYSFENYYYYSFTIKNKTYYFKNLQKDDNYITYLFLSISFLIFILSSIHLYIIKALKPLKELHKKIHAFANHSEESNREVIFKNLDEIALVSLEFDKAVERIEKLKNTRTLFWRNIMHEFKTPLTQGMLMVHMSNNNQEEKEQLINVFSRMQEQLDKLKHLEYISSDNLTLKTQEVNMLDIIDDIKDILNIKNTAIKYTPVYTKYMVNSELFIIALKNLIANAIAYSPNRQVQIVHNNQHLYLINKGEALKSNFELYTKAFVREDLSKSGMGLGLYLSKEIFLKHHIKMKYKYINEHHLIILDLKNVIS